MATAQVPLIYDEMLDYLAEKATPEEILAFQASARAEERAAYLLDRNNSGDLTPEESIELHQMLYLDSRISVLKARATRTISVS